MSETRYLMYKDIPIVKIRGFNVEILDFDRLPYDLKTEKLDFDMIFHGWTEMRIMNIGRTNGKSITAALGISQRNTYAIGSLLHFTQFTDCYWIRNADEKLAWCDVNQYDNSISEQISKVSLTGEVEDLKKLTVTDHLHSPELGVQGLSAKCLIKEADGLYMYKVARREIAASQILDQLEIPHVRYVRASDSELSEIAGQERLEKIRNEHEVVSKCKIISNQDISLLPWESFCVYCEFDDKDPYKELDKLPNAGEFHKMNIADYILGNDDRHIGNWGFYIDNADNSIIGLHPLMDHDHAFSIGDLKCQTTYNEIPLKIAAIDSMKMLNYDPAFFASALKTKPDYITEEEWGYVLDRCNALKSDCGDCGDCG